MQQDLKLAPFGLFNPIIEHNDFLPLLFFLNIKKKKTNPIPSPPSAKVSSLQNSGYYLDMKLLLDINAKKNI